MHSRHVAERPLSLAQSTEQLQTSSQINSTEGRRAIADSAAIRATAEAHRVFYTTTLAAAEAVCMSLKQEGDQTVRRLQDLHRSIPA